ncbi:MAG TPA: DNA-binding transcriptional regulator [Opitutaceae bacterium]|nr:DNA-binding transcriptional regulator [Opitutaceae bacterium]
MRPQVLLIFMTHEEECSPMLKGIGHYERSHRPWNAFLDDEGRAATDPRWLRSKPWRGVISKHTTPQLVKDCATLGIPLVDMNDSAPYAGVPKIKPDNPALGHLGAEHFVERGYGQVGFCGFSNQEWACERRDGFVEAANLAGLRCDVFDVEYPGDLTPSWDEQQAGAIASWLRGLSKPVGVMACNDMRALQVMAAAERAEMLVPEELAVLGANNDVIRCELVYPPLSSVSTNPFQSGYRAAEMLDQMMLGEKPREMVTRVDPVGVVTRHSTDVLAIEDKNVAAALSYIREHACSGIAVEQVLKHAAASRSQLEKKFRRHLGRSPQAEIRRVQVARIRQLLIETDFPLKKIAELTGFEHVEYMCVLFKRLTSITPGACRKKYRAEELR